MVVVIRPSILHVHDGVWLRDGCATGRSLQFLGNRSGRSMEYKSVEVQRRDRLGYGPCEWLKLGCGTLDPEDWCLTRHAAIIAAWCHSSSDGCAAASGPIRLILAHALKGWLGLSEGINCCIIVIHFCRRVVSVKPSTAQV